MANPSIENALFQAAILLADPKQRSDYLDAACQGDSELRRRIEKLLKASEDDGFMHHRAIDSLVEEDARPVQGQPPRDEEMSQSIDRFKLLQKIGEGGFGIVYMAEQQAPVVRRVALKILKPGMDSKQVVARFEAERQALALMEHPFIAQVYDAGETQDGRPYFVMELVRGVPVIDFCDQQKLSNRERLKLFRDICDAIQHAHQKGIIHRDLKPTNILITMQHGEAIPKVIDFGIAKATQQRLTDKTLFTRFEQFVGTPAYMSPEQAQMSSLDVDTRSDIYSLGILLYELLTGTTPLNVKKAFELGFDEVCRQIREVEFEPPSKRVSSLQLDQRTSLAANRGLDVNHFPVRLRGELDWIVMKAVDKDRRRRYETANAFATDIDRYLSQQAVTAAPPSLAYQLSKLIHRHRVAVLTTLAIATLLIIGTTTTSIGMLQAIAGKRQTEVALEKAQNSERKALKTAYLADMYLAHEALRQENLALARRILQRNRDFDSDIDPRNWEWRALWLQCQNITEKTFPRRKFLACGEGNWFADSDGTETIQIREIPSGKLLNELDVQGADWAFSPNGSKLLVKKGASIEVRSGEPHFDSVQATIHADTEINRFAVSPDDKWLVAISSDAQLGLYELSTGERVKQIEVDAKARVAMSTKQVAVWQPGYDDTSVRLFELNDLNREKLTIIPAGIQYLTFSPDGATIGAFHVRRTYASVFSTVNGELLGRLQGHSGDIKSIAFSPDGKMIATGSVDHTVRIWDATNYSQLATINDHERLVLWAAFSRDGQRLFSQEGIKHRICVWKISDVLRKRFPVQRKETCDWWRSVSLSPNAKLLAATKYHGRGRNIPGFDLRSTDDLEVVHSLSENGAVKTGVRFSPVQNLVAVGDTDGTLELIDINTEEMIDRVVVAEGKDIYPCQFSRDGLRLVIYAGNGELSPARPRDPIPICAVYSVADRRVIASWKVPGSSDCAAISADGTLVATGHADGVRFWSIDDPAHQVHIKGPHVNCVDFSPDGNHLVAGGKGPIRIIDVKSARAIDELVGHINTVAGIRFSPDGTRVASAGWGKNDALRMWDFETRREVLTLTVDNPRFNRQIDWSIDGNTLLMMGGNANVSIWRVPSMEEISEQEGNAFKWKSGVR